MAGKRAATSELNSNNWNEEDEPEDAGTFKRATEDIMEQRVIKTAKRRLVKGSSTSAFGSFTGFKTISPSTASPFSFLANANSTSNSTTSPSSVTHTTSTTKTPKKTSENGGKNIEKTSAKPTASDTNTAKNQAVEKEEKKQSSDYFAKLKGLNECVAQWIKGQVDSNPFCILTPVFQDYEKYLEEIESKDEKSETKKKETSHESIDLRSKLDKSPLSTKKKTPEKKVDNSVFNSTSYTKSIFSNSETKSDLAPSIFGTGKTTSVGSNVFSNTTSETNPFFNKSSTAIDSDETQSFVSPVTQTSTLTTAATFSFGQSSTNNISAGFSFGSGKPFSFGAQVTKPQDPEENTEAPDNDEDDEPPKPDFKPVTEEGAIYEQRCKVFVKKDGNFNDRGIGILFLKPTSTGKIQLIVRADTSLGNLLLNILLTNNIPTKRMNKNTIMIMCLPMPDSLPPPTPVLLRVKTSEEADDLLAALDGNKN